jgi:hypothetical protein
MFVYSPVPGLTLPLPDAVMHRVERGHAVGIAKLRANLLRSPVIQQGQTHVHDVRRWDSKIIAQIEFKVNQYLDWRMSSAWAHLTDDQDDVETPIYKIKTGPPNKRPCSYNAEQTLDEFMDGITFDVYPMHPCDIEEGEWSTLPTSPFTF